MDSLYQLWKSNTRIGSTGWSISGSSVAGIRTSFYIPELKILLDAGNQNFNKVADIFITHCHADHVASLPLIILENINNKITTNIYCPQESIKFIENMVEAFLACNYNNYIIPKKYLNFLSMSTRFVTSKKLNAQSVNIRCFESDHVVPTLSYGFIEEKKKLKEEYIGLSGPEIVELKKQGVEITKVVEFKKLIFCGDTTANIFRRNPEILNYDSIIVECTFFEDDEIATARERKHMHWKDLKQIVIDNPSVKFYLIHISAKYHNEDSFCNKYIEGISNIFVL
jgi:ribonuclease Z